MQVFDNGCFFSVTCTAREVEDFSRTWPCSGLAFRAVTFQFDKSNGDLVDSNDQRNHPNAEGGAMLALCDDAMRAGESKLGLQLNR